jgi:Xaa-Pro aminopeptidase
VEAEVVEVKAGRRLFAVLKEIITGCGIKRILISKSEISLEFSEALLKSLQPYEVTIENTSIIKDLRIRKDDYEIELIRHNLMITELGYHMILPLIKEGRKEYEIAADLEYFLKKKGAKRPSFDTIVASGERSAFPHGSATDKKIDKDGIILLDFGIFKDGYCSDFTRCYYLGKIINAKIDLIHSIVLDALKKAEGVISEGVRAFEVHEAAMGVIKEAGYGEYFTHSTGHGVGLQIHEAPAVTADSDVTLSEGMIITVEPGIYLPGTGGVRLEDMVLVKKDGCEVLTSSGYEL